MWTNNFFYLNSIVLNIWVSKTLTMGASRYHVEKFKKVGNLRLWGEAKSREGDERVLRKEKNSNQWWVNR